MGRYPELNIYIACNISPVRGSTLLGNTCGKLPHKIKILSSIKYVEITSNN